MRIALVGLALLPVLTFAAPAHADFEPTGFLCGFSTIGDPTGGAGSDRSFAEIDGGPLLIDDGSTTSTGHLTCTLQLWPANTHTGVDTVAVSGPDTPHVVALPATVVPVDHSAYWYYLCTSVTIDGETLYFDDPNDPTVDGSWSTDPTTAECGAPIECGPCGGPDPLSELIDAIVCPGLGVLEPTVPDVPGVLELVPQSGDQQHPYAGADVYVAGILVWDCSPYRT